MKCNLNQSPNRQLQSSKINPPRLSSPAADAPFTPQLSEVEEARWFGAAQARRVLSFKNSLQTLDAAVAAVDQSAVAP